MPYLDEILKHHGVKGMKWGVRRDRNRPGGADGKAESEKTKDKRGRVAKTLDSMKRERQWNKVLNDMDKLSTTDINQVARRVRLENDLKNLSKSKVGTRKDRDDYLRRDKMSDAELQRKVTRLRAKDSLRKSVKDASKEQREFGEKVVNVGKTLAINKFILKKSIEPKDLFNTIQNPKESAKNAQNDLQKQILNKISERKSKS